ncbi:MAG: fatty acid desaturase, partial [Crocosphaera sp.]
MTTLLTQSQPSVTPHLDDNIRLRDILKTLPAEVFVKSPRKAWFKVILTVSMVSLGWAAIAVSPWY